MEKRQSILIIEDEVNLVELLKFRLEANGYMVQTAFDGEEGLRRIKELKPDCIILDIMMPKMHGYDVCRLAKLDSTIKEIPIIMLTAHTQKRDMDKAMQLGAAAYISKPFDPDRLLEEIKKHIGR